MNDKTLMNIPAIVLVSLLAACASKYDPAPASTPSPVVDYHQHLVSSAFSPIAKLVAKRIRQLGPGRVLYGSDLTPPGGSVAQGWRIFRTKVPLSASELQQIAGNQTRFVRAS